MDDKITIIEGPPPAFEDVHEGWPLGLNESPTLHKLALTRLRTFNGPSLVERCYRAWHKKNTIQLEFRAADGLIHKTPIVASRTMEIEDGQGGGAAGADTRDGGAPSTARGATHETDQRHPEEPLVSREVEMAPGGGMQRDRRAPGEEEQQNAHPVAVRDGLNNA